MFDKKADLYLNGNEVSKEHEVCSTSCIKYSESVVPNLESSECYVDAVTSFHFAYWFLLLTNCYLWNLDFSWVLFACLVSWVPCSSSTLHLVPELFVNWKLLRYTMLKFLSIHINHQPEYFQDRNVQLNESSITVTLTWMQMFIISKSYFMPEFTARRYTKWKGVMWNSFRLREFKTNIFSNKLNSNDTVNTWFWD